jgi:hypothetical protein
VLFAIWTGTYEPKKQRTAGAADAEVVHNHRSLAGGMRNRYTPGGWQEAADLIPMQEAQQLVKASGLQVAARSTGLTSTAMKTEGWVPLLIYAGICTCTSQGFAHKQHTAQHGACYMQQNECCLPAYLTLCPWLQHGLDMRNGSKAAVQVAGTCAGLTACVVIHQPHRLGCCILHPHIAHQLTICWLLLPTQQQHQAKLWLKTLLRGELHSQSTVIISQHAATADCVFASSSPYHTSHSKPA